MAFLAQYHVYVNIWLEYLFSIIPVLSNFEDEDVYFKHVLNDWDIFSVYFWNNWNSFNLNMNKSHCRLKEAIKSGDMFMGRSCHYVTVYIVDVTLKQLGKKSVLFVS